MSKRTIPQQPVFTKEELEAERWRWISGFRGRYAVSDLGRVKSFCHKKYKVTRKPRILKVSYNSVRNNYPVVNLSTATNSKQKQYHVHVLVLETFLSVKPTSRHVCRHFPDKSHNNNRLSNIQWGTPEENMADMAIQGGHSIGEANAAAKLTEDDVRTIRKLRRAGLECSQICWQFDTNRSHIHNIITRKLWKCVKD